MDNYPDDIRSFDNDPRSPFYSSPFDGLDEMSLDELRSEHNRLEGELESVSSHTRRGRRAVRRLAAISDEITGRYADLLEDLYPGEISF